MTSEITDETEARLVHARNGDLLAAEQLFRDLLDGRTGPLSTDRYMATLDGVDGSGSLVDRERIRTAAAKAIAGGYRALQLPAGTFDAGTINGVDVGGLSLYGLGEATKIYGHWHNVAQARDLYVGTGPVDVPIIGPAMPATTSHYKILLRRSFGREIISCNPRGGYTLMRLRDGASHGDKTKPDGTDYELIRVCEVIALQDAYVGIKPVRNDDDIVGEWIDQDFGANAFGLAAPNVYTSNPPSKALPSLVSDTRDDSYAFMAYPDRDGTVLLAFGGGGTATEAVLIEVQEGTVWRPVLQADLRRSTEDGWSSGVASTRALLRIPVYVGHEPVKLRITNIGGGADKVLIFAGQQLHRPEEIRPELASRYNTAGWVASTRYYVESKGASDYAIKTDQFVGSFHGFEVAETPPVWTVDGVTVDVEARAPDLPVVGRDIQLYQETEIQGGAIVTRSRQRFLVDSSKEMSVALYMTPSLEVGPVYIGMTVSGELFNEVLFPRRITDLSGELEIGLGMTDTVIQTDPTSTRMIYTQCAPPLGQVSTRGTESNIGLSPGGVFLKWHGGDFDVDNDGSYAKIYVPVVPDGRQTVRRLMGAVFQLYA